MDPVDRGRLRGFRAPGADPADQQAPAHVPTNHPTNHPTSQPTSQPVDTGPAETAPGGEGEVLTIGKAPLVRKTRWARKAHATGSVRARGERAADWRWAIATAGVLVVAIAVIATLAFKLGSSATGPSEQPVNTPAATPSPASPLPVTDLYQQVVPSVVMVTTSKGSLGSGVIVNDTGLVLTAHHVIAGGGAISVLFGDGTKTAAKVAATNPKSDIATLAPAKLPEVVVPAVLGGGVAVGSDVVAIGNPLGLRGSTTTGIVSGLDRTTKTASGRISGLIQFDAAVNPGSSGGPLLDAQGLVVGVVVSIADPGKDDAFAGIGFAVPIGTALAGGDGDGPGNGGPRL